ncbi:hypothetical protein KY317_02090 [Candidatus Woesearchaeota archaeon]|nr:hypothetical protein [Candidatus Woesearchaeota archaeon]
MSLFVLLTVGLLMSGCAVSDYLRGEAGVEDEEPSLLTEEKELEDILGEIGEIEGEEEGMEEITGEVIEEIEEEIEEFEEEVEEEVISEDVSFVINAKENELVKLKPEAVDDDEDVLTYTFSEPLDEKGEWHPTYGDAGEYIITVTASDGTTTTSQDVLLIVERVNVAPSIEPIGDIEINEGETLLLEPVVSDVNNDVVTVTISDPVGDDGIWETDYHSAGEYFVTITAEDAESKSTKKIKIIVNYKNMPPTISNVDDMAFEEGETAVISPTIDDLNGDKVIVSVSGPFEEINGEWIWDIPYNTCAGHETQELDVTITADDGRTMTTKEIIVTVTDVNIPPKFIGFE